MVLIALSGRCHIFGQPLHVAFPQGRQSPFQFCQVCFQQDHILVASAGAGGLSLLYLFLYLYLWWTDVGRILRTFKIKKNVEVTYNGKIII